MSLLNLKSDFPALSQKVNGQPICYLDSAASSLKPQVVIDAITHHYTYDTANVHRGIHFLSAQGTTKFEETRTKIKEFINAKQDHEIIFTKGATESINLVASSWSEKYLNKDDIILVSTMEHHSNIVPWQMAAKRHNAYVKEITVTDSGDLDLNELDNLLKSNPGKVKMVAISAMSNTLGTVNPINKIIEVSQNAGAHVLIDAAQSAAHKKIDVAELNCDFIVFSAHKMLGPTGVGVLYGKEELLNSMPPYQGGGAMIKKVTIKETTYNDLPEKFEAGTPNIAGVIAFKSAIEYLEKIGLEKIWQHEKELLDYATSEIMKIDGVSLVGTSKNKGSVLSFTILGAHPHDLAMILDEQGIAIRTGHHCTGPLMDRFSVTATARASFALYNDKNDVDRLISGIKKAKELL
jgi:cysteine desulfurase/selenocysteine lyase